MSVLDKLFPKKDNSVVALEFQASGVAIVVNSTVNDMPTISQIAILNYEAEKDGEQKLKHWVQDNNLKHKSCNVVLDPNDYQLILVEPPDVEPKELRNAIRWRLKELLTIPVEEATIDVFPFPEDGTRANKKMVYVVAAETKKIQSIVHMVHMAGLTLNSIDIGELAIRNIARRLLCDDDSERGLAVTRVQKSKGSVYIYRQGNIYLARNFSLDYGAGLMDDLPEDVLALEIQRSLDYYERQMGQAPPSVTYICGDNVTDEKVGPTFRASLAVSVQVLDPSAVVFMGSNVNLDVLKQSLGALGGALREGAAV